MITLLPFLLAVPLSAQTAEELDRQALAAYRAKEFVKAVELFEKALALPGADPGSAYNGACAAALAGQKERALALLEKSAALGGTPWAEQIERDTDLASLKGEPRLATLLANLRSAERVRALLWDSPALASAYREELPEDERVAGLSKVWSEVKYNFAFPEKLAALDWDAVYLDTIPKAREARSTADYYRVLQAFAARLRDGHTGVYPPEAVREKTWAQPGLRLALVEGRVLALDVFDPELRRLGVVRGDELVTVDGVPVHEHALKNVQPYESASTAQDLDDRVYGRSLLRGPVGTVRLGLLAADGTPRDVTARRMPWSERKSITPSTPPFEFRLLAGNVAYVALNAFDDQTAADEFVKAFPRIASADALILDVRRNGGGSSDVGYRILGTLTDRPFATSRWSTRDYKPTFRAWGRADRLHDGGVGEAAADGKLLYKKPVVVLAGPSTFSAAEDFLVAFDGMKRGRIVGEASGGSTGQPLFFRLPGGGVARVCTKRDTYPDGKVFVGVGVQPQQKVWLTLADARAGRDTVLEAALASLSTRAR